MLGSYQKSWLGLVLGLSVVAAFQARESTEGDETSLPIWESSIPI